ncbi:unnamed protein product, partial [marine sediment metagenome]
MLGRKRPLSVLRLDDAIKLAGTQLKVNGTKVFPNEWQATSVSVGMHEIFDYHFTAKIPEDLDILRSQVKPDLPWADEHFDERVGGEPLNPAPSYERWPYYKQDEKWRKGNKFSHTYPERMWPRKANNPNIVSGGDVVEYSKDNMGIRYRYGDLNDVITLLIK